MAKLKKSEYIRVSRTIVKKLFDSNCFGKGSVYHRNPTILDSASLHTEFARPMDSGRISRIQEEDNSFAKRITPHSTSLRTELSSSSYIHVLKSGIPMEDLDKVEIVLEALIKQNICCKKKKEHGWKYYLNIGRYDKIVEIIKEKGKHSIIPVLLML